MAQPSIEVLICGEESVIGTATVHAALRGAEEAGWRVTQTKAYRGGSDWLCVFGAGSKLRNDARERQIKAGGKAALWDLGYFSRGKDPAKSYVRVSINHFHPWRELDRTPNDSSRWDAQGIALRNDFDPAGHVVVAGMGPKSRVQFSMYKWEIETLRSAQRRFPGRKILYRPKPQGHRDPTIAWEPRDGMSEIGVVLKGASLAICRHSNIAVDACIAGVPVETVDGAAFWLYSKTTNPDEAQRRDFLHRLSYWQYKLSEMAAAWGFLDRVTRG